MYLIFARCLGAAAATAAFAVALQFDSRYTEIDLEQIDGGGSVKAFVHELNYELYQPYVQFLKQREGWGAGFFFGGAYGPEPVAVEYTGNFSATTVKRVADIVPGSGGVGFFTTGDVDSVITQGDIIVGQQNSFGGGCFWAADRNGSRSGCLGVSNAFGEGYWPGGPSTGPSMTVDKSYGVIELETLGVVCTTMSYGGGNARANQGLYCWDRRLPAGSQLYIVHGTSEANSAVKMGDTRICLAAVANASAGFEMACVDFADASAMPPTASMIYESVPGAGGIKPHQSCNELNGVYTHAIDSSTLCWLGKTPQSPSAYGYLWCSGAMLTCYNLDTQTAALSSETWTWSQASSMLTETMAVVEEQRAVYLSARSGQNRGATKMIKFDVDTGNITPLMVNQQLSRDDKVKNVRGVPGRGVLFSANDQQVRSNGNRDIFFWSGNATEAQQGLDDFDSSDQSAERFLSPYSMLVSETSLDGTTTVHTTVETYSAVHEHVAMRIIIAPDGTVTWGPALSTGAGTIVDVLPGRGKNGGVGFLQRHNRGNPLFVSGQDVSPGGITFSYWNGDPSGPNVPLALSDFQTMQWREQYRDRGFVLRRADGYPESVMLSSEAGILLLDVAGIYDGAPDMDASLRKRYIYAESRSYQGAQGTNKRFARSSDGSPCFVTNKEVQRGWVCMVEDPADAVGYSFVSAADMPSHPLAHPSRRSGYLSSVSRYSEDDVLLEETSGAGAVFRQPRELDADDWSDSQIIFFDGDHAPVRLMYSIADGPPVDDNSGQMSPISTFALLDGGTKVAFGIMGGSFDWDTGLVLVDMAEPLNIRTYVGEALGVRIQDYTRPMIAMDRFMVFMGEDPATQEGYYLYSADSTDPHGTFTHLHKVYNSSDNADVTASLSLFGGSSPYVAVTFEEYQRIPGYNGGSTTAGPVDNFVTGEIHIVELNSTGGYVDETVVSLGVIYGDFFSARDGFHYDDDAYTIKSLAPCDTNDNHTCIVEWGPGQDPPAFGEVLFTEGEFIGPNSFLSDGSGVLVAYAGSEQEAEEEYSLAFFDLMQSPAARIEVDQGGVPLVHDTELHEPSHMEPTGEGVICWMTPSTSENGMHSACVAPRSVHGARVFHFGFGESGLADDDGDEINIDGPMPLPASRPNALELFNLQKTMFTGKEPTVLRVVPPTPTPSTTPTSSPTPSPSTTSSSTPTPSVSSTPTPSPTPSTSSSTTPSPSSSTSPSSSSTPTPSTSPTTSPSMSPTTSPSISPSTSASASAAPAEPVAVAPRNRATDEAVVCAEAPVTSMDSQLLQVRVDIAGALPSEIGCAAAESFVEAVVTASGVDLEDVTFWLEPMGDSGTQLLLQMEVRDAAEANTLQGYINPQLLAPEVLQELTASVPSAQVTVDDENAVVLEADAGQAASSAVVVSDEGDDEIPVFMVVVVAVLAIALLGSIAVALMCCECKGARREQGKAVDTGKKMVAVSVHMGAEAV